MRRLRALNRIRLNAPERGLFRGYLSFPMPPRISADSHGNRPLQILIGLNRQARSTSGKMGGKFWARAFHDSLSCCGRPF